MANRIPEVKLSGTQLEMLVQKLRRFSEQAIEYKGNWDQLHAEYERMYLAQPEQEVRSFPWPRASNAYLPIIRSTIDSLSAEYFDAKLANPPRVIGVEGSDIADAELLTQFYFDVVWNNRPLNLKEIGNDWNHDTLLDGTGVMKTHWDRDKFLARYQVAETIINEEPLGEEFAGEPLIIRTPEERLVEQVEIQRASRPVVESVAVSRLFVAPGSGPSMQWPECPWFYEELPQTLDQMLAKRRSGGFDNDVLDEALNHMVEGEFTDQEREQMDYEHLGMRALRKARMQVWYMRLALPGSALDTVEDEEKDQDFEAREAYPEEVVIWYFPDIQQVGRVVPLGRLRPDNQRPFVDNRFNRLPRSWFGQGIAAKLRQMEKLYNTAFRQLVDYGTLRNLPWFFYQPAATGLIPDMTALRPGQGVPVMDPRGVVFPNLHGDQSFQIQWMQLLQQWLEKDTAVTDFTQGRSTALPNAPRTARGTLALLNQSSVAFSYRVALFAERYRELFLQVHNLYRMHADEDIYFRVLNRQTGAWREQRLDRSSFQQDVDFLFELNPNRIQEQQNNFTLAQLFLSTPFVAQNPLLTYNIMKKLYNSFGDKDFDELFPESMFTGMPPEVQGEAFLGSPPKSMMSEEEENIT